MEKQDLAKMFTMIVVVFIVFSVFRSWENNNKVSFAKEADQITIYSVSFAEGKMLNEEELEKNVLKVVDNPGLFFKSINHDDDTLVWDGDYYARIQTIEGEKIDAKFSDFAYVFEVEGEEGHFRFKLTDQDSWLFY